MPPRSLISPGGLFSKVLHGTLGKQSLIMATESLSTS